ncbi:unnamed protein product [Spirodela intermedia]|uniref:CG-1 domain-containing protein n=1 Tax=Spirodela intermedia TaxID=51605 RepID=A0A7I8KVX1_SPIIN|nr:unnamed protein product [Spirodela intermedia]
MADARRYAVTPQLDIQQILLEAQSRWLRPAEICEILRNYRSFQIAREPPNRPPSGSLFLFDRKVLRYFRKDGHNWRKKKDNKTVKEAHEKLKDGSIDVLHCYYAHGEDNEKFQRRTYWMLEEEYTHIVLVHYREVQGTKPSFGHRTENEEISRSVNLESPASSNSISNHNLMPSRATDAESPNSSQTFEYEDAESDNHQASSRYRPHFELQQFECGPVTDVLDPYFQDATPGYYPRLDGGSDYFSLAQMSTSNISDDMKLHSIMSGPPNQADLTSWDRVLEHCAAGSSDMPFSASILSTQPARMGGFSNGETSNIGEIFQNESILNVDSNVQEPWQPATTKNFLLMQVTNAEGSAVPKSAVDYSSLIKQLSLDIPRREGETGLTKYDSFTRWMSKELGEVDESQIRASSSVYWDALESEGVIEDSGMPHNEDTYLLGPSLSQDQLFSIIDFSPNWSYTSVETKVRVTGKFLVDKNEVCNSKWSCMFGEIEVPAEVSGDSILICYAPPHKSGRVDFYVTCSNRLACSEIREFQYRVTHPQYTGLSDSYMGYPSEVLHMRFEKLLSLDFECDQEPVSRMSGEKLQLSNKIGSLLREDDDDEWSKMLKLTSDLDPFPGEKMDPSLERALKEKLHAWLIYKIAEDGKGPTVLDKEGQGVIHLAAALGYYWAVAPTIVAGVSIDFRDVHGWTALHWAAYCGREKTVGVLFTLGAAPGALTDPTPEFPSGRTPADLASSNGHKGIAGFLAESSLTTHLSTLTLKELGTSNVTEVHGVDIAEDVARKSSLRTNDGNMEAGLSAIRNAAQAAARIHQVFRIHSFQRKKLDEYEDDKFGMSDEQALSLISGKTKKTGRHDEPVAAAIQIQKKFRGWKGRKEFLTIRQHIVKIQAHVRGHQVRKHYRKIVWTVGIVEKAILRWRRKGPGLRNFKPEGSTMSPAIHEHAAKEDDYDFLKEGRKQTEARLEKALDRVKSMVQYPEARDQYRRLLAVVEDFQESKVVLERVLNDPEVIESDPMFDIDELLGDDPYMPIT